MYPQTVTIADFERITTAEGSGMLRLAHRADSAGTEFFLSMWFNDRSKAWVVFKAPCDKPIFYLYELRNRSEAMTIWGDLVDRSCVPNKVEV